LRAGTWAKLSVEKNGVYKIDYEALRKAGFDPEAINPHKLQLFGYPTGMLPQSNSISRPQGLVELAIQVSGEEDGKFNSTDALFFYGQGPDQIGFDEKRGIIAFTNNLYSDKNFYFLTVSEQDGKRLSPSEVLPPTGTVTEFLDFAYYETDSYNELKSGREWYGESFESKPELTIRFPFEGIVPNSEIKLVSNVMAQTYNEAKFQLFWNNVQLAERVMPIVPQTQYGAKGRIGVDTLTFSESVVGAAGSANQDIKYQYTKGASLRSAGYLNYVLFQVKRKLAWYGGATPFMTLPSDQNFSTIQFASPPSGMRVWDITEPFNNREVAVSIGNVAEFAGPTFAARSYVAFVPNDLPGPTFENKVNNQDLSSASTPHLLIVTYPDWRQEADRLADHRRKTYGIDVLVVSTEEIYQEFSGGRQDVAAIRDFTRHLYRQEPGKLKNLLLFGRGSYDYKKRVFNNTNFVPTYESRNSLNPLDTYSSDDFFGFLEDNEGEWSENPARNHTLDIGVGRLPVRSLTEAKDMVEKLISYDSDPQRYGGWRQGILFVADDGDFNIHQGQAEELAESIETYGGLHSDKVYLDSYEQEDVASGQISPKAADALRLKVNKGFAIVNFTGHGSEQVWMQERILDPSTPGLLTNKPKLPLFVTATCEFGRHDDPQLISTAELLLKQKKGGAIGLVTTTRPVNSGTNFSLNKAFYSAFFSPNSDQAKDLGSIFRATKNNSQSGVANRNFSLLGDPSLRFGPPLERVVITSVKTALGSDTLKALSKVVVEGRIQQGDNWSSDFNGTLELALYDKRTVQQTLGDENPVFSFKTWAHTLFRGKASIVSGEFIVEMVLPVGLADEVGQGKISAYAVTEDKSREALGTFTDFKVGKMEPNSNADNLGPDIQLFMGDTTFVRGGIANANTRLVGVLHDSGGINISGYAPANLVALLDNEKSFVVNDYFVANPDDFTTGTFSYPIYDLAPGMHTIEFTAFDNHGNKSVATITFEVGKEGELLIENLFNFPNPFSGTTTVRFSHSRSGEDLEAQIQIFDILGQMAGSRTFRVEASTYQVDLFEWDGTNTNGLKMNPGTYLMKLSVRSLSDGAKKEKFAKLILVN
jgi:hypothetical protein